MNDDAHLLRRFADEGDHEAFAEVVRRHVDWVHTAAVRQLNGDSHLAADATQLVFVDLARKAASVAQHPVLAGWLFTTTRYTTAKLIRGEQRRRAREAVTGDLMQAMTNDETSPLDWDRVRPVLDEALAALSASDREAILLRFFAARSYADLGQQFNVADNTARMRVERALDKLRLQLERRGVTSTAAALTGALASQAVAAAPAGLAAIVAGAAVGTAVTGTAVTGAIGAGAAAATGAFMSITKLQMGIAVAVVAAGGVGIAVQAQSNAELARQIQGARSDVVVSADIAAENLRLARTLVEVEILRGENAELPRLQQQTEGLQARLRQVAAAAAARQQPSRAADETYTLAQLDQRPTPRFQPPPKYPADLRATGTPGEAIVDFIVGVDGDVRDAKAIRVTHEAIGVSAVEAVSQWQFTPGRKGGRAVETRMQMPIVFRMATEEENRRAAAAFYTETQAAPKR